MHLFNPGGCLRSMFSHSHPKPPRHPLITILGSTGTGKSELAVSLARRVNGEIINGDALQLYQGLPIVTNKIDTSEQHGIRHHLLGTVPLTEETWTAPRFTREATRIIDGIRDRGRIPILVGGTHYYLQSTLFKDALVSREKSPTHDEPSLETEQDIAIEKATGFLTAEEQEARWPILKASSEEIRAELLRVDPVIASRWHPKDSRKIRGSLLVYLQTGRPASEIYAEQAENRQRLQGQFKDFEAGPDTAPDMDSSSTSILRYDNLLLWTYTPKDALDTRLLQRVEKMIQRGLLDEIKQMDTFRTTQERNGQTIDFARGIWVAIGYKEFASYLHAINSTSPPQSDAEITSALADCKEKTYFATRQYAKYQQKWIRNKLHPALSAAGIRDRLFLLDSTDPATFATEVEDQAADITSRWLSGAALPTPESISTLAAEVLGEMEAETGDKPERVARDCEICGQTLMDQREWELHIRNSKHRRLKKRETLREKQPMYAAALAARRREREQKRDRNEEKSDSDSEVLGLAELDGGEERGFDSQESKTRT